jgi:uncharacterized protein YybS (DUF2232 family)
MKNIKLSLLVVLVFITASFSQIITNDLDNLRNDLNRLLGKRYYILKNYTSGNEVTVVIFKRFDVTRNGGITYYEYPENMINFLSKNINRSYSFKIKFEVAPYVPPTWIDDSIRKEKIMLFLLSTLIGVISLFVGFIIYRRFSLRSNNT